MSAAPSSNYTLSCLDVFRCIWVHIGTDSNLPTCGHDADAIPDDLMYPMDVAFVKFGDVNGTLGLQVLKAEM